MPMIGGTTSWVGPLIGAILLGSLQQIATVTISSAVNLLIVGLLLVAFVIIAPNGLVGLMQEFLHAAAPSGPDVRSVGVVIIAIYAFLLGLVGIVLSVPDVSAGATPALAVRLSMLLLSIAYAAASYGLLTLKTWGLWLAALVSVVLIAPWALQFLLLPGGGWEKALPMSGIVASVVVVWFLLRGNVRLLYHRDRGKLR